MKKKKMKKMPYSYHDKPDSIYLPGMKSPMKRAIKKKNLTKMKAKKYNLKKIKKAKY